VTSSSYVFQPMTAADLPLVLRWLQQPHVMQWWGDTHEQFELVSGDLEVETMDQFIVAVDGRPFGYIQCYDLTDWNSGFGTHPAGTRGIDQFIGEPDMIGCGHGSAFIRAFVEDKLSAGAPRMVTDPDPANARAIRAYEKAGFARDRLVDTPDGIALLMVRDA
jgi:aminoglycoside 6'-N-acetyltransferase